jgi:DNA repair photolyase
MENIRPEAVGRGANVRPANRFAHAKVVALELVEPDADELAARRHPDTRFLVDDAKSVVTENASPDVGFRYSLNPYRGCEHGCSYCYARPTHEYLGYDAGLGFETRILVKRDAPALFRRFLAKPGWAGEPVALSGVTDPYQPCEREYRITRRCLNLPKSC